MGLNQEQKELQKELKMRADAFVRLCEGLPKNIVAAWIKLVGYIREHCYMDEKWDGRELTFCVENKPVFTMILSPEAVIVSFMDDNVECVALEINSPESVDGVITIIKEGRFPGRVLPDDDVRVSAGGGRCDLCLHNCSTIKKQDRRVEMALGFAKYFGDGNGTNEYVCMENNADCLIRDIGEGTPGLSADEVTHIAFPYWWIKSSLNKDYALKVKPYLSNIAKWNGIEPDTLQLPDCELLPASVKVIMISEVPPKKPDDGFYSGTQGDGSPVLTLMHPNTEEPSSFVDSAVPESEYMKSTLCLFGAAGVPVKNMRDILEMGIYVTTAVKTPKTEYTVDPEVIKAHLPILRAEISLFPNLKAIMLMGDVAKKAVNAITKAETKKNVIPSGATGRLRHNEYYWDGVRVFPSYIMTGKNLLIEPFKRDCVANDIRRMMEII